MEICVIPFSTLTATVLHPFASPVARPQPPPAPPESKGPSDQSIEVPKSREANDVARFSRIEGNAGTLLGNEPARRGKATEPPGTTDFARLREDAHSSDEVIPKDGVEWSRRSMARTSSIVRGPDFLNALLFPAGGTILLHRSDPPDRCRRLAIRGAGHREALPQCARRCGRFYRELLPDAGDGDSSEGAN